MSSLWPPTRRDLALFGALAAALFIAWLPHLVPGAYSVDDYWLVHSTDLDQTLRQEVSQGRFVQAVVHETLVRLGADPIHASTLLNMLALLLLAACGVLLARLWTIDDSPAAAALAGALAFTHPFAAELWSFRLGPISFALALAPALLALVLLRRTSGGFGLPVALLVLSLGVYQVNLNPLLVAIALGAALDLARVPSGRREVANVLRVWGVILACVLVATVAYFALEKVLQFVLAVAPEARAGFVAPRDLGWRARQIAQLLPRLLFKERALGTGLFGILQVALLALTFALAAARSLAERSAARFAATAGLLAMALLSVVGVLAVLGWFGPTPRLLTAAGFFWAGVLALAFAQAERSVRAAAGVLGALLWLGSAGLDHRAAAEQQRVNARDVAVMGRIVGRLEALPGSENVRRLFVAGGRDYYPDLPTATGDLNRTAFGTTWAWAGLMAEVGGPWVTQATEDDRARATAYCARAGKWPARDAVTIEGDLAIACF